MCSAPELRITALENELSPAKQQDVVRVFCRQRDHAVPGTRQTWPVFWLNCNLLPVCTKTTQRNTFGEYFIAYRLETYAAT